VLGSIAFRFAKPQHLVQNAKDAQAFERGLILIKLLGARPVGSGRFCDKKVSDFAEQVL